MPVRGRSPGGTGTNQGLITHHFGSTDVLWRAAADRIFGLLQKSPGHRLARVGSEDRRERNRGAIRA